MIFIIDGYRWTFGRIKNAQKIELCIKYTLLIDKSSLLSEVNMDFPMISDIQLEKKTDLYFWKSFLFYYNLFWK